MLCKEEKRQANIRFSVLWAVVAWSWKKKTPATKPKHELNQTNKTHKPRKIKEKSNPSRLGNLVRAENNIQLDQKLISCLPRSTLTRYCQQQQLWTSLECPAKHCSTFCLDQFEQLLPLTQNLSRFFLVHLNSLINWHNQRDEGMTWNRAGHPGSDKLTLQHRFYRLKLLPHLPSS